LNLLRRNKQRRRGSKSREVEGKGYKLISARRQVNQRPEEQAKTQNIIKTENITYGVRAYSFLPQGWDFVGRGGEKPLHHRVNTETRHGITISVDEQASSARRNSV
jgi:hypothetical protein